MPRLKGNSSHGSKPMTWLSADLELNAALLAAEAAVGFDEPLGRVPRFIAPAARRHVVQVRSVAVGQRFDGQREL